MSIIAWIVLGAIAGYLAGLLVRGDEGLGVIGHIVLGIVGALVGHLNGLSTVAGGWTIEEVEHLLFVRELVRLGRIGS